MSDDVVGPAEIEIGIRYEGDGMPTIEQLGERQSLEKRLEEAGCGEITDTGAGQGLLEIYVEVEDAAAAMPVVERLVAEMGLTNRTTVEATALE
jgi:hypothetical protein